MATTLSHTTVRVPQRTGVPHCPSCGGLECLCRPRFFAGQLLTEEDLNRLDHYIVAKHKLHNRYLHGWGVVCGLDVVCDGCGTGNVMVTPGYALSPCGEDIVVCGEQRVAVCDLIEGCRDKTMEDCYSGVSSVGCDEPVKQWVLAICYTETPSRGVAPLRTSGGCGCGCGGAKSSSGGCGCGGGQKKTRTSGDCGCGCGGAKASSGTVATTSASRGASLMQCENTIVCESYCFRVYEVPRSTERTKRGALEQAFLDCISEFRDAMPTFAPTTTNQQELHDWCCDMHDAWADWFIAHPPYACDLPRRIAAIACPTPGDQNFTQTIEAAKSAYLLAAVEVLLSCFCTAIMPPCPDNTTDNCVPLAVITVRNDNGCRVESICNWTTQRKYLTTFPSLQYWLSMLPFGRQLREALESFCCKPFLRRQRGVVDNAPGDPASGLAERAASVNASAASTTSPASAFRASAQSMARSRAFIRMALNTLTSRDSSANAEKLVLGLLGEKDAKGTPYLGELETENLLQFLVLDQMVKPSLANALGDQEGGVAATAARVLGSIVGRGGSTSTDAALGAEVDELRASVSSMRETVTRQQAQIAELLRRSGPNF